MKAPRFSDLVDVEVQDGEIVLTCTACGPPQVIGRFAGKITLDRLIAAANDHDKDR